jgi:hypothetical protein
MPTSRKPDIRPAAALVAFLIVLLGGAGLSAAADTVAIDVGAVYASNSGSAIDPALIQIRGKLRSMFNYTSYKMLERRRRELSVGETGDFELPGRRNMRVRPLPAPGNKVRLAIQLQEGGRNLLTTTLGLRRGGMVLVGGPSYDSGVLILIIAAD